ncbi:MAG TPA: hypothetical protein VED18_03355 [Candidatus Sulfotelmatobacter sp.]|nr:hypothetical protein [Candidatus Sulfotelmatobacter sp.]
MRATRGKAWIVVSGLMLVVFLGACASPPHLQRPLTFPSGTVFPASIAAAEKAIADAKAAGAANVQDARYPLAKAEAFLLNAKEEFAEGDPTSEIDDYAKIALKAAQEALQIARQPR